MGTPAAHCRCDEAAAEKAQPAMIEIVALEIVDRGRRSPGADERIDLVVDEHQHARGGLVAIVLADDALARRRIIRLADAGGEQELRIVERIGA
jgi:hypothetical protein